jgi:Zn-dependent protease
MKWSWKIGEVSGIGIYVHWTFLILILWILLIYWNASRQWAVALEGVGFVLAVFGCVVLHELGHALTAKRFHIRTRDITLYPIGGMARLERMPEVPLQELWVALAGPAVNIAIAAILLGTLLLFGIPPTRPEAFVGGSFLNNLMWVNLILVAFNILPAFPMDGGRVLRALLARKIPYVEATQLAASIGQAMAILFGLMGLLYNPLLIFIALFVFLGAQEEARMVQMRSLFEGIPVRDAMITHYCVLDENMPLSVAVEELLAGSQEDFPVTTGGEISGVLTRADLLRALARGDREVRVGDVMRRDCQVVEDTEMLDGTFQRMREDNCSTLPVVHAGKLVGVVTLENVGELIMIRSALRQSPTRRA